VPIQRTTGGFCGSERQQLKESRMAGFRSPKGNLTYKLYIDITNKPKSNINKSLTHLMPHLCIKNAFLPTAPIQGLPSTGVVVNIRVSPNKQKLIMPYDYITNLKGGNMKYIIALLLTLGINTAQAEAIAQSQNEGGGFIVLTNEVCVVNKKTFSELRRVYSYTQSGLTQEGCFMLEDDTVVVVWESGNKRRYAASGFILVNRGKNI